MNRRVLQALLANMDPDRPGVVQMDPWWIDPRITCYGIVMMFRNSKVIFHVLDSFGQFWGILAKVVSYGANPFTRTVYTQCIQYCTGPLCPVQAHPRNIITGNGPSQEHYNRKWVISGYNVPGRVPRDPAPGWVYTLAAPIWPLWAIPSVNTV